MHEKILENIIIIMYAKNMKNGRLIKNARLCAGYSRRKLAKAVGCSVGSIVCMEDERDNRSVGVSILDAICHKLGITVVIGNGDYIENRSASTVKWNKKNIKSYL
jgi:DNA-binding XRE family transcriptional regulator